MNEMYAAQLERAMKCKTSHPYLLLSRGPSEFPCSVHEKNNHIVLPVIHEYWRMFPMREAADCKCRVRNISKREFDKIRTNGVQDSHASSIIKDDLNTGHREKYFVPIKIEVIE